MYAYCWLFFAVFFVSSFTFGQHTTHAKLWALSVGQSLSLSRLSCFLYSPAHFLSRSAVCFVLNRISPRTAAGMRCLSPPIVGHLVTFSAHLHLEALMSGNLNFIVIFILGKSKQRAHLSPARLYRAIWRPKECSNTAIKAMCLY